MAARAEAQACAAAAAAGQDCAPPLHAETARGLALGTGARASAVSTSALTYNPAALVVGRLYHIEGGVDYIPQYDTVALGAAAVDSSTSRIGAGIAVRGFLSGKEGLGGIDGRLALAFPFSEQVSLGVGARYVSISADQEVVDTMGVSVVRELELAQGFTMDASFRVTPVEGLHFSVAALNFVDLDSEYVPVLIATSAALGIGENGAVGIDLLMDMSSFDDPVSTIGGGIEYLAGASVPLRGGYMVDLKRKLHSFSAGVGYTDRTMGIDISLQQQVKGGDDTRVLGNVRYYVR